MSPASADGRLSQEQPTVAAGRTTERLNQAGEAGIPNGDHSQAHDSEAEEEPHSGALQAFASITTGLGTQLQGQPAAARQQLGSNATAQSRLSGELYFKSCS